MRPMNRKGLIARPSLIAQGLRVWRVIARPPTMKRLGVLTAISHHRWWIVTPALLEPETASRSRPLAAETALLH